MSGQGPSFGGGMSGSPIPPGAFPPGSGPVGIGAPPAPIMPGRMDMGGMGGGQQMAPNPFTNGGFGSVGGAPNGGFGNQTYQGPAGLHNFWQNPPSPGQVMQNISTQGNFGVGGGPQGGQPQKPNMTPGSVRGNAMPSTNTNYGPGFIPGGGPQQTSFANGLNNPIHNPPKPNTTPGGIGGGASFPKNPGFFNAL